MVSSTGHGHASINRLHYQTGKFALGTILTAIFPKEKSLLPKYLFIYLYLLKDSLLVPLMQGSANVSLTISALKKIVIVVPAIKQQKAIYPFLKALKKVTQN
jgi:type I restriction enzyme S subunit